jgi:YihY family inner membrane protein
MHGWRSSGEGAVNRIERIFRSLDSFQQRQKTAGFVFGVVKKFGDDNGGVLVANLTYTVFLCMFPLLLILVTVLVNVAASDPALQTHLISTATSQFPLVGRQLGAKLPLLKRSSVAGLIVGLLLEVWGTTKLAQAGSFTMEQVWNLPGPARPGYLQRLVRSLAFLGVLALVLVASTLLASLVTYGRHTIILVILGQLLAAAVNAGLFFVGFRVLTPKGVPGRLLLPGAVTGGITWTVLQGFGAFIVHHFLHSDSVYGIFASVLALLAWIYLGAQTTVYAAEINVVTARRLWPRSMVQPPLTESDRASLALQALKNQRRPEQEVSVTYTDRPGQADPAPGTPQRPAEISPPATSRQRSTRSRPSR